MVGGSAFKEIRYNTNYRMSMRCFGKFNVMYGVYYVICIFKRNVLCLYYKRFLCGNEKFRCFSKEFGKCTPEFFWRVK